MRGARALGFATLLLAGVIAAPALSAAEDPGDAAAPPAPAEPGPALLPEPPPSGEDADVPAEDGLEPKAPAATVPAGASAGQGLAVTEEGGSRTARAAASASVSVGDNFYSPATVTIRAGDTVSWRNNGQSPHSATADDGSFDTGVFGPGQSRSHTFDQAGTFAYFCTVHGQAQSGTVRVEAAVGGGGGGAGTGGATAPGPSEADATAAPNAAGNSSFLPATGFGALGLAAVGLALLVAGTLLEHRQRAEQS